MKKLNYFDNLNNQTLEEKNVKINNKIIHQSKLLKYFEKNYEIKKVENDLLQGNFSLLSSSFKISIDNRYDGIIK